ncbi:MAG: hypothetical protein ACT4O9_15265 [Blastocatellia bacterium]
MAIFDAEEIETKESKWSDVVAGVLGCLLYIAFGVGGIAIIVLLIRGVPWIAENVYPIVTLVCTLLLLLLIPLSIVLSIFRKTRPWAGLGFTLASYALGLTTWLWTLILAYVLAGTVWMIIGLLFAGVGVVFIAFVASLLNGEWAIAIQVAIMTIVAYGLRGLGTYLVEGKKEEGSDDENFSDFWEEYQRKAEMLRRFGEFMEHEKPLIPDIETLPFEKQQIHDVLWEKEQEMCDLANQAVKDGETEKLPELEKMIGALGSLRVVLHTYCDIDPEDQDDVDYFNSYSTIDEIPEEEKLEFGRLFGKYLSKGMALPSMDEGN